MVSSVDGEQKADDLVDSCKSFFQQDSAALSDQELAFQLENMGCQDVSFSHGTVQSILPGHLLYNAPMCPSNLSIFCFFEKLEDGEEKGNRILLWVMGKEGRTRSKDEIQKSLKQVVVTPLDYAEMKTQTVTFMFVTQILFGADSMLPLALKDLYANMLKYSSELKHKFKGDKLLTTKILFAVDQEIQRWLKENRISKMREEVDDEILE